MYHMPMVALIACLMVAGVDLGRTLRWQETASMTASAFEALTTWENVHEDVRLAEVTVVPEYVIINGRIYTLFTPPPLADI